MLYEKGRKMTNHTLGIIHFCKRPFFECMSLEKSVATIILIYFILIVNGTSITCDSYRQDV